MTRKLSPTALKSIHAMVYAFYYTLLGAVKAAAPCMPAGARPHSLCVSNKNEASRSPK